MSPFSLPNHQASEPVKSQVADAPRQALDVLKRMLQVEQGWTKACEPRIKQRQALNESRGSAPTEFDRLFAETQAETAAAQARLLALRFELKDHLTAAEWTAVFPVPAKVK